MVFAYVGMGMALHAIIFPLKWARSVGLGEGRPSRHCLPTAHIMYHISYCMSQSHFERQRHGLRTYTNSELEIQEYGRQYMWFKSQWRFVSFTFSRIPKHVNRTKTPNVSQNKSNNAAKS